MKELPFDAYDVFGYVASGLTLVVLGQLTLGFPKVLGIQLTPFELAALLLVVYIAGQVAAGPSKFFLEDILVHRILASPAVNLMRSRPPRVGALLFPGFYEPLPPPVRAKLSAKLGKAQIGRSDAEGVFLAVRYCPSVLKSASLMQRVDKFRDRYGFCRNVSFSLIVSSVILAAVGWHRNDRMFLEYASSAFLFGVLLFYRYLSFFRQYSFELFNTYAWMSEEASTSAHVHAV